MTREQKLEEALMFASMALAQVTSRDGSGHADVAISALRIAGISQAEREKMVSEWKEGRNWGVVALATPPQQQEGLEVVPVREIRRQWMDGEIEIGTLFDHITDAQRLLSELRARIAELEAKQHAPEPPHLNPPGDLPPVDCPILIELTPGQLVRAERTKPVPTRGDDMQYRMHDGSLTVGKFRWTYP